MPPTQQGPGGGRGDGRGWWGDSVAWGRVSRREGEGGRSSALATAQQRGGERRGFRRVFTLHWGLGEESGLQREGMRQADCSHRKGSKKALTKLLLLWNNSRSCGGSQEAEGEAGGGKGGGG